MERSAPGRPREFDDAAVVEAAMDVFWTHGYDASSAQELCDRTGLGRGSLYNAFGSKQNLYRRALIHYQEQVIQAQEQILREPGTAKDRLRALLQWGIERDLGDAGGRGCMVLNTALGMAARDPAVAESNRIYAERLTAALCHVFAVAHRNGEINGQPSALEMARAFLGSIYGLRVLGQSVRDRDFLEDAMEGMLARL